MYLMLDGSRGYELAYDVSGQTKGKSYENYMQS